MTPEQKESLLQPGTIWKRKKNGGWERVYLERVESSLVFASRGNKYIDFRTPFGEEYILRKKFLAQFTFLGWAKTRLEELTSDKNLIPSIADPRTWMDERR